MEANEIQDIQRFLGHPIFFIDNFNGLPVAWADAVFDHSYHCPHCGHEIRWYLVNEQAKYACNCDHIR
jgi:hypothetical protein